MELTLIRDIQGDGLFSPISKQTVRTMGVVTGVHRRGFFLQTPDIDWDRHRSDGIFVYSREWSASKGALVEVVGEVVDYLKHETAKPVTQIRLDKLDVVKHSGPEIEAIDLTQELLPEHNHELACLLNSLEGMLLRIPQGQTFIAPSNSHGDYVVAMDAEQPDNSWLRSEHGGVIITQANPLRWFPGFRVNDYRRAPRLNVGAKLLNDVVGPLNYRADAYQLAVNQDIKVEHNLVSMKQSGLKPCGGSVTIMTLNCFNLDPHIESPDAVLNPRQDIDDDWGAGRFHTLAHAIVLQANLPDIVALQEIQDNDGAEISEVVDADQTYRLLINAIEKLSGLEYHWVDVNPELGADGGQPGGNIRNGFLYNPKRVSLLDNACYAFGADDEWFDGSRKPLLAKFTELESGQEFACINVHLASKRHQESIFAPTDPGVDARLGVRLAQASRVRVEIKQLQKQGINYYVTGDFNDTEHSHTLQALLGDESANLVELLDQQQRYDYNHRGKLQVLMHGIVSKQMANQSEYEIIHGNELIGVTPGEESDKPSDHAYVIAKLKL